MSNKTYFISDLHFGHDKDFIYEFRGFSSIKEHDEKIIENFNSVVTDEDDVYILGDLMLGDQDHGIECLQRLKGKLHIVRGNHCTNKKTERYKELSNVVELIGWATVIKHKKWNFYLSHYPTCVGNGDDSVKMWCICGHTHTENKFSDIDKKCYHVEPECQNNFPVEIEKIIEDIQYLNKV